MSIIIIIKNDWDVNNTLLVFKWLLKMIGMLITHTISIQMMIKNDLDVNNTLLIFKWL